MIKPSAIGWTDYSGGDLNFVSGCTPVSEGCQNCYARAIYERFGRDFGKVTVHHGKLLRLSYQQFGRSVKTSSPRPMCFVCDTGDLFHEVVPSDFIRDALGIMGRRPDVIWQVLTKRPERLAEFLDCFAHNVWMGITAENQRRLDERLPHLAQWPGTKFISVEPMLEPVTLGGQHVDFVICGAESGPNRRPFDVAWAEALYDECREAGIPFFAKQDSALRPGAPLLIHGKEVREWPL